MAFAAAEPTLSSLSFKGTWRHYQQAALEAFEHDRRAGRRRTHIVAPPGSGKTLLGVELVRRLGVPALVLVPNSAVQAQWLRMVARFTDDGISAGEIARPDPDALIACLTYQAFCQVDDPSTVLGDAAERRWAAERAATTQTTAADVRRTAASWRGTAAARRKRELARITATIKREIARGDHAGAGIGLDTLLTEPARRRIDACRRRGVGTLVLDECHHLGSLWGYVVRAIEHALGDVHLVGLTGTPPEELTQAELELYRELLGPVDYTIPTPAVVREGYLAPYQELAWLTRPLDSETAWLAEHDRRFQELITALHSDDSAGPLSFPAWIITRARDRGLAAQDATLTWASFQRRHPALARACVRFIASAGLALPDGAPRGEGYRQPPDLTDWLVLLEDYTLRCLRAHPSPAAAARDADIAAALRDLGFTLTRQGIRRGRSDVDRLLSASAAKTLALTEVISCEDDARGPGLRALVLTDTEAPKRAAPGAAGPLEGVLRADAGSAVDALRALASNQRTSYLRPLLVSGRGLRCAPEDATELLQALAVGTGEQVTNWRAEPAEPGLVRLVASGVAWQPRLWVGLATGIFIAGVTRVLVGTRALLGEGWDAPSLNVLVDLTVATTAVSVRQMRGRSLRLDPADPAKIASNWDVVCVAPELARGTGDYQRFVRKHLHLFAPSEDGVIEAGPSHVHPDLGPFTPPPADAFTAINQHMRRRVQDYDTARQRWGIGQSYLGEELATLVVRPRGRHAPAASTVRPSPPAYPLSQRLPLGIAGTAAAGGAVAGATGSGWLALGMLAAGSVGLGAAMVRLRRVERELGDAPPLDLVAHAIVDAYLALGEISEGAAASLAIEPRASGYLRCALHQATSQEATRFTAALQDVIEPVDAPRYLISRLVPGGRRGPLRRLGRVLLGRPAFLRQWHAVPDDLGRTKARATAFAQAWRRWLGPSTLLFTQRSDEGRRALAEAGAQAASYDGAKIRNVWV
jgi:superfamily II DNA or RNA helicase